MNSEVEITPLIHEALAARVADWTRRCFGEHMADSRAERNHRFLEEAVELVQACGCGAEEVHAIVDYVFSRKPGVKTQELGGTLITLAALSAVHGLNMDDCVRGELNDIEKKIDRIREKRATKPQFS